MKFFTRYSIWLIILIISVFCVRADETLIQKIAFGSCLKQTRPQPIWKSVLKTSPNVFILLGDNIYGDTQDMDKLKKKWEMFGAIDSFNKLRLNSKVLAVWDDHDYGENDAGIEYPKKKESQNIFLDFFGEPKDTIRRKTPGIYDSVSFGPVGKRVQIILLDTRYFRTSLKHSNNRIKGKGPYSPNYSKDAQLLGQEQWIWLKNELSKPAELRIIASSIQVLSSTHGWETWGNFPLERNRLLNLLAKTESKGVVVISGDRHSAEISKLGGNLPFPLYDITSSAMNQRQRPQTEDNKFRIGEKYFNENFGLIQLEWVEKQIRMDISIRGIDGDVRLHHYVILK